MPQTHLYHEILSLQITATAPVGIAEEQQTVIVHFFAQPNHIKLD